MPAQSDSGMFGYQNTEKIDVIIMTFIFYILLINNMYFIFTFTEIRTPFNSNTTCVYRQNFAYHMGKRAKCDLFIFSLFPTSM